MIWVLVLLAIALGGVIALALYAVSLSHRAADVKAEIDQLGLRVDELRTLVGQLEQPSGRRD